MSFLTKLETLIQAAQRAEILYQNSQGIIGERKVSPKALCYTLEEGWLLIGYCHKREGERSFRLARIKEIHALDEFFPPPSAVLYRYFQA